MSDINGYRVGGTDPPHHQQPDRLHHLAASSPRSSQYCTDVAKTVQAPIFHVNGDDPEACVRVARLAFEYRQQFHKDVVIDMVCYRRHGHNEGDDPSYTQPLMYKAIAERRSVRKLYAEALVKRGDITLEEAESGARRLPARLQVALDETRGARAGDREGRQAAAPVGRAAPRRDRRRPCRRSTGSSTSFTELPGGLHGPPEAGPPVRGAGQAVPRDRARSTGPRPRRSPSARWSLEGTPCASPARTPGAARSASATPRSSTTRTGKTCIPLATCPEARPSSGSTTRCSASTPRSASSTATRVAEPRTRWCCGRRSSATSSTARRSSSTSTSSPPRTSGARTTGLVLLLPHGYEGQGPEHSSARIERFLTLCAEDNIQVANATTAAQYFHLLRRQVRRDVRKPLVVFTPKSPLRMKECTARRRRARRTGSFQEVLDDPSSTDPDAVQRLVFCSRQGGVGRAGRAGQARRAGGDRADRAAVPVPAGAAAGDPRALPERPRARVAAGGAGEHGSLALHRAPHLADQGAGYDLRHVARVESGSPATGRQDPRPGAARPARRRLTVRRARSSLGSVLSSGGGLPRTSLELGEGFVRVHRP